MKKREYKEHITKPVIELHRDIVKLREHLQDLQFDLAAGKIKNIKEVHHVKKSIAQLLTIIRARNEETH